MSMPPAASGAPGPAAGTGTIRLAFGAASLVFWLRASPSDSGTHDPNSQADRRRRPGFRGGQHPPPRTHSARCELHAVSRSASPVDFPA